MSSRQGKSWSGYVTSTDRLTETLAARSRPRTRALVAYFDNRNAVIEPLVTFPKVATDNPAKSEKILALLIIAVKKTLKNLSGRSIDDSTGRIRQMPSKEYRMAQSANGTSFQSNDGSS
jgi:hypothetical protein